MYVVEKNVSLEKLNTFGVEIIAQYFIRIQTIEDLFGIFNNRYLSNIDRKLVLGGGSNLLCVDKYYNGLILHMSIQGFELRNNENNDQQIFLTVGAGEKWQDLINYTLKHGYHGLEYLAGIPGTVGGAPIQNIGAYGTEISDVLYECQVFDVEKKCLMTFDRDTCEFSYRSSLFKKTNEYLKYIITSVTFCLTKCSSYQYEGLVQEILERRATKLPDPWLDLGNAGSFFTNPIISNDRFDQLQTREQQSIPHFQINDNEIKLVAGWLIEGCQWKGKSIGLASIWHSHANILVNNRSKYAGYDLWKLAKDIRRSIENRYAIRLDIEINIIRHFQTMKSRDRNLNSSKLFIRKSSLVNQTNNIKQITIPADKNVCVHLLFCALAFKRIVHFFDGFSGNLNRDISCILRWIDDNHLANLYFHSNQSLIILPNQNQLTDLSTASFSRASIDIAGYTLLTYGHVRCMELGGCQFTTRPIDLHRKLLLDLGGMTDDEENFYLKKDWNQTTEDFEFNCRTLDGISSVGLTIHAIMSCCALPKHIQCQLTNIAFEPSVQAVIQLAKQYRPMIVNESERIIRFEKNSSNQNDYFILEHLPIDQIYLFTIASFAMMLQFKIFITNFEYDQCITEFLRKHIHFTIDDHVLIDGKQIVQDNEQYEFICDIYPHGLPTDISPILTSLLITQNRSFKLIDRIYNGRHNQCDEYRKLNYDLITHENEIIFDRNKQMKSTFLSKDFFAHDIRSGVAVLLMVLYEINRNDFDIDQTIVLHQYEQIERGYGSLLLEKLIEFGFDIQLNRHDSSI